MTTPAQGTNLDECRRILAVTPQASRREIKLAFRRKVRQCHPDMNPGRPEAETELKQVVQAYRILMERASRPQFGGMERRFRQTHTGAEGFHAAPEAAMYAVFDPAGWRGAARGALAGFCLRLLWLLVRGGVRGINYSPTPHWSILGLGASGALLCAMIAANTAGVTRRQAYELGAAAGLVTGAAAALAYNLVLDAFATDPARAWSLAAFAAAGGIAGSYLELRTLASKGNDEAQGASEERLPAQAVINAALATMLFLLVVPIGLFALWQALVALRAML